MKFLFSPSASPQQKPNGKRIKESRKWDNSATGEDAAALDFSNTSQTDVGKDTGDFNISVQEAKTLSAMRGIMKDTLEEVHVSSDDEDLSIDDLPEDNLINQPNKIKDNGLHGDKSKVCCSKMSFKWLILSCNYFDEVIIFCDKFLNLF